MSASTAGTATMQWAVACTCTLRNGHPKKGEYLADEPWPDEESARSHCAVLVELGHPAIVVRRTIFVSDWKRADKSRMQEKDLNL